MVFFNRQVAFFVLFLCDAATSMSIDVAKRNAIDLLSGAVVKYHIRRNLNAMIKKDYSSQSLDDSSISEVPYNVCAAAVLEPDGNVISVGSQDGLTQSLKSVSEDVGGIAVFVNGGTRAINDQVIRMFSNFYSLLYPTQFKGVEHRVPEGRHTDAEQRAIYALYLRRSPLSPGSVVILISLMDTCKYCALSLAGFLAYDAKASRTALADKGTRAEIHYVFSYSNPLMKLSRKEDMHEFMSLPYTTHCQVNKLDVVKYVFGELMNINGTELLQSPSFVDSLIRVFATEAMPLQPMLVSWLMTEGFKGPAVKLFSSPLFIESFGKTCYTYDFAKSLTLKMIHDVLTRLKEFPEQMGTMIREYEILYKAIEFLQESIPNECGDAMIDSEISLDTAIDKLEKAETNLWYNFNSMIASAKAINLDDERPEICSLVKFIVEKVAAKLGTERFRNKPRELKNLEKIWNNILK